MTVPKPIRDELDIGPGDVLVARSTEADGEFIVQTAESVWD